MMIVFCVTFSKLFNNRCKISVQFSIISNYWGSLLTSCKSSAGPFANWRCQIISIRFRGTFFFLSTIVWILMRLESQTIWGAWALIQSCSDHHRRWAAPHANRRPPVVATSSKTIWPSLINIGRRWYRCVSGCERTASLCHDTLQPNLKIKTDHCIWQGQ